MALKKVKRKSPSPYQKYNKAPYVYSFRNCTHKNEISQSGPFWKGKVCNTCNTIIRNFGEPEHH